MKINKPIDHLNYFTHLTTGVALFGASTFVVGSPIISTLAISTVLGVQIFLVPKIKDWFRDSLPPAQNEILDAKMRAGITGDKHVNTYKNTLEMSKTMQFEEMPQMHFYNKDNAPDHIFSSFQRSLINMVSRFSPALKRAGESKSMRQALSKLFLKYANAAAFSHLKQRVIYSEPLIKKLDQDQIDSVSAHELCHLKAGHIHRKGRVGLFTGSAKLTASFNFLATAFSSLWSAGLVIGSAAVAYKVGEEYKKFKGYDDDENRRQVAEVARVTSLVNLTTLGSLAYMTQSQELLFALGITFVVKQAANLINKSLSRANEYQADRVASEITKNPKALIKGLNKISKYNLSFEPGMDQVSKPRKSFLGNAWSSALNLFATHPTVEKRSIALLKQEQKMKKQKLQARPVTV